MVRVVGHWEPVGMEERILLSVMSVRTSTNCRTKEGGVAKELSGRGLLSTARMDKLSRSASAWGANL